MVSSPGVTPMDTSGGGGSSSSRSGHPGVSSSSSPLPLPLPLPPTTSSASASASANHAVSDQAVLEYLRSKGMGSAVLELQDKLKPTSAAAVAASTTTKSQLEAEDDQARNQRLTLTKATGGGFGYDRDAAVPIVQWGVPDTTSAAGAGAGGAATPGLGVQEARAYLDSFCALQLWVLSLPDDAFGSNLQQQQGDAIRKAKVLMQQQQGGGGQEGLSLQTLLQEIASSKPAPSLATEAAEELATFQLPPSAKPELLSVTFALWVHTYCELLEVGMETTAHVVRDAFGSIYEPLYGNSTKDLWECYTTEDVVKLNTHNSQHMEALAGLKQIVLQIKSLEFRQEVAHANISEAQQAKLQEYQQAIGALQRKHNDLSQRASQVFEKLYDLPFLRRARAVRWQLTLSTTSYGLLAQFLNNTSMQSSLLAMSTLLQTKCELHVERRDPLPFTPAIIWDDSDLALDDSSAVAPSVNGAVQVNWAAPLPPAVATTALANAAAANIAPDRVRPFPPFHLAEEYPDESSAKHAKRSVTFNRALLVHGFRRLEALERKREFDVMHHHHHRRRHHGKRHGDHQHQHHGNDDSRKTTPKKRGSSSIEPDTAIISAIQQDSTTTAPSIPLADPLEPSILLSTLCANSNTSSSSSAAALMVVDSATLAPTSTTSNNNNSSNRKVTMTSALWEEAGIGLTCAQLCPPDGRRVAVGCDDAAVRIWDLTKSTSSSSGGGEVGQVLLGHKNGFPVFDVSWNKDGRSLLSAGGDGSIRLWDTLAQGPFGQVLDDPLLAPTSTNLTNKSRPVTNATAKEALHKATEALLHTKTHADMSIPGLKAETTTPYQSGAALAVYRGHAPHTPVWSVAFAPCGYYFASAGGDATARLWTTDRPVPVRVFVGHTSKSVHSIAFHPNCNYLLTGSDDHTVRMWDIQTGRCVRLLNGCAAGINQVQIDPSGQYAVGADMLGIVHLWDLGTGKKVTEFRPKSTTSGSKGNGTPPNWGMVHAMSFSACGTALATGGDDPCIRIWDIQQATQNQRPVTEYPRQHYPTHQTMILDLEFTKRNLLLSVGKYISAVPLVTTISD